MKFKYPIFIIVLNLLSIAIWHFLSRVGGYLNMESFMTVENIINPYFVLFVVCINLLFVSILLLVLKPKPKPVFPPSTSKSSEQLSQAEKSMARVSEINRLTSLLEKKENEIAVEQAKGDYLIKLPDLLKKKEQYLQELEKLR